MSRNNLIQLLVLFLLAFCILIYIIFWSPKAQLSKRNVENSKLIELGMSVEEVIKVMGEPQQRIINLQEDSTFKFYYRPPAFSSDGIFVEFTKQGIVEGLVYYE